MENPSEKQLLDPTTLSKEEINMIKAFRRGFDVSLSKHNMDYDEAVSEINVFGPITKIDNLTSAISLSNYDATGDNRLKISCFIEKGQDYNNQ